MLAVAHSGGLLAEAQLLSQVNLKASDEWNSLQGNLRDEGFLLLFFFFSSYFLLLGRIREIYERL